MQDMPEESYERKCHVKKKPDEQYEFFLKDDDIRKGQIITGVSAEGPADRSGLKNGDRIIAINGSNVEDKSHSDIVNLIKESMPKNEIEFVVVDKNRDPNASAPKTNGNLSRTRESELRPRLCKMKKDGNFGFNLEGYGKDKPGHFLKEVTEDGPAYKAGVRNGDRIIEVGGVNVEKYTQAKVVSTIQKQGSKLSLLVVDDATYRSYSERKMKIKAKYASVSSNKSDRSSTSSEKKKSSKKASKKSQSKSTTSAASNTDEQARLVHVIKGSDRGFGFFLRVKKDEAGEYIGNVEEGKSAARCGLMEDDRVLAANGKTILLMKHDEVVEIIKSNTNHAVFLVAGPKAVENAKTNGILAALSNIKEHILEKPRKVKLERGDNGYGFFLKWDKTKKALHVITDIENGSIADREGMKDGEVVASVGNDCVFNLDHETCVKKIKEAGNSVELTIATAETVEVFYDLGIEITDNILESWPDSDIFKIPDLSEHDNIFRAVVAAAVLETVEEQLEENTIKCTLKKIDGAFGFFLRDDSGHFLGTIEKGGAADVAGIRDNDQIIEVNGVNVLNETHDQVVRRINDSGDEVTFSVRRKEGETNEAEAVPMSTDPEYEENRPLPRYCELSRLPSGYGFHLNSTDAGDRPGQYLTKVVNNGAAHIAGVREGDRVIEVNGVNISIKSHEEVVALIRQNSAEVALLVVDKEADQYYKKKGLEITKALLVAKAIAANADDAHSNAPSSIEAEATVHVDPEQTKLEIPADISFPPPPEYEDKAEEVAERIEDAIEEVLDEVRQEDVLEEIQEIAEEIREEVAEEIQEEVAEEIREEVAEGIAEKIKEEVKEDIIEELKEEISEEVADEVKDAIAEEVKEEIREHVLDEIAEDIHEKVREELKEDLQDEIAENIREEVREELKENLQYEIAEQIRDEVREELSEKARDAIEDDIREEIREEIKDAIEDEVKDAAESEIKEELREEIRDAVEDEIRDAVQEDLREEIVEEVKDEIREEIVEEIKDDIVDGLKIAAAVAVVNEIKEAAEEVREKEKVFEEPKESQEEMMERIQREMREKIEKEMREKMEEEMRQKLESQMTAQRAPPPPPPPAPEPLSIVLNPIATNVIVGQIRPQLSEKKRPPVSSIHSQNDNTFNPGDIVSAAKNLRSIKKVNEIRNEIDEARNEVEIVNGDLEEKPFKPSVKSFKAMFESGKTQPSRPSWQRPNSTPVQPKQEQRKTTPAPLANQGKTQSNRQFGWGNATKMSFNIVETSAAFN